MAALIREPPRRRGPRPASSLRSSADEVDVSAIARKSGGGGHRQAAASRARRRSRRSRVHRRGVQRSHVPPRALEPAGIVLVDKPAGPVVLCDGRRAAPPDRRANRPRGDARPVRNRPAAPVVRARRRGSRVLRRAGQAVSHRRRPDATTSTGDPTGEIADRHERPIPRARGTARAGLRGEIELPIPAASAVKIDGERAYRLHRKGIEVSKTNSATSEFVVATERLNDRRRFECSG